MKTSTNKVAGITEKAVQAYSGIEDARLPDRKLEALVAAAIG